MYFYNRHNISTKDINEVVSALKSSTITKGKYLNLFENKLKKYFNSKYALVFTNGTMALFAISKCLQWSKDDYIILSPYFFVHSLTVNFSIVVRILGDGKYCRARSSIITTKNII